MNSFSRSWHTILTNGLAALAVRWRKLGLANRRTFTTSVVHPDAINVPGSIPSPIHGIIGILVGRAASAL